MYTNSDFMRLIKPNRVLFTREQEQALFTEWFSLPEGRAKDRLHTKIILNYSPIVYKTVRAMDGYVLGSHLIEQQDLGQVGIEALVGAAKRFNIDRELRFATYAQTWVRGMLYAYIAKNYFPINLCANGSRKKMFFSLRTMIARHNRSMGENFDLTPELTQHFADAFDTTTNEVTSMLGMFRGPTESLSEMVGGSDRADSGPGSMTKEEAIPDQNNAHESFELEEVQSFRREVLIRAMNRKLDEREKAIYSEQLLNEEGEEKTLQELGERFGVSKERIRQIRDRAENLVAREVRRMIATKEITREDIFA